LARYLALDWDHNFLHVVSANVGRGTVQVQRAAVWRTDLSPNPANAAELGAVLRERLKEAGIAPAPLLVAVGRDRVILKDLRYPQVPASEEPAIVRFQAAKELTYPADEVVIDYAPTAEPGPNGERRAHALILRRELLQTYQALAKAAGLKLAGITPRPFGVAASVQRAAPAQGQTDLLTPTPAPEGNEGAVAVLTLTGGWAEFDVVRGGRLLFTRALPASDGLVGEIRRNLALYAGQPQVTKARDRVQALFVAGNGEHNVIREQLQQLLAIPVHPLDPFAGAERLELGGNRGGFAGAVGLLHAQSVGTLPINFAQPKEPRPERDPNQARYVMAAGVGLLVLILVGVLCGRALSDRTREIARLQGDLEDMDGQLMSLNQDSQKLKELHGWTGNAICWLDELVNLSNCFDADDTKLMHLNELTAGPTSGTGTSKQYVGQILVKGEYTQDEQDVNKLVGRMVTKTVASMYRIASKSITPPPDDRTPAKFEARLEIEKQNAAPKKANGQPRPERGQP
jgi:Tfp pilus assembly PilM family ATPase